MKILEYGCFREFLRCGWLGCWVLWVILEANIQVIVASSLEYKYLLFEPNVPAYSMSAKVAPIETTRFPLVIYLHGRGESGDDLTKLERHGPPLLLKENTFPHKQRWFFLVAPQSPQKMGYWKAEAIESLKNQLVSAYPIDPNRVTITGQSMGSIGVFATMAMYPDSYLAGLALCGRALDEWVKVLALKPLWIVHGDMDTVIPVDFSRSLVSKLKEAGSKKVFYDELKGQGHMIHNDIYKNPEVWHWLTKASY